MTAIRPNAMAFQQLAAAEDSGPVVMLNLLKFKERADSGDVSGRESYERYGRNVKPMVEALGGRILWQGRAEQLLIGEDDWDTVVLVEYPSRKAFIEMAMSQQMNSIHHHREAGLERTVLMACRTVNEVATAAGYGTQRVRIAMESEPIIVEVGDVRARRTPFGDDMRWVVGASEVSDSFSLHHRTALPGSTSIPHSHRRVTEAFYVLDGRFEFEVGGRKLQAAPGTYVQATKGTPHAWRVIGDEPAHALVIFTPSVAREFFDEIDAEVRSGKADRQRLYEINVKYGLD